MIFIENADILCSIFSDLVNTCFLTGSFPNSLKKAEVLPLYKKGDSTTLSNYRPISILPIISKIIEKCMKSRLTAFIDKYSIVNAGQFGFQRGVSTQDAILQITEQIYESLNKNSSAIGIFIDFSKAFDTINRNILLKKLEKYGIRGLPLRLLASYLENRTQAVRVGNVLSPFKQIDMGLPQGSVLAPLLFILYVNDLPCISNLFSVTLFADDATLFIEDRNYDSLIRSCNSGLELFLTWCWANRLSVNIDKTHYLIFSNKKIIDFHPVIKLNNRIIEQKSSVSFLGMELDDKLKFNFHINNICNKISKNTGIIYRLREYLPLSSLIGLYYSFIFPYLNYCHLVWGGACHSHIQSLEVMQRKCVRTISGRNYMSHSNPLFSHNKILKISDIFKLNAAIFMFNNMFKFVHLLPVHSHETRFRSNFLPSFQRLSITQRQSLFSIIPSIWNSLPEDVKNSRSLYVLKRKCKNYLLSGYMEE